MGIYLPNIKMPQDEEMLCINIYPDGKVCFDLDLECKRIATAVPVPPHGRLGDLGELEKSFREDADAEWNRFAAPVNWADAFDDIANIVADAPTIIQADED